MARTDSRGIPYAPQLLARLNTCIAGDLPASRELLVQLAAAIGGEVSKRSRLNQRDKLIRRAGLLTGATKPHAKAGALVAELRAMQRLQAHVPDDGVWRPAATVRECLQEAAVYGRLPDSGRHFIRILTSAPRGD